MQFLGRIPRTEEREKYSLLTSASIREPNLIIPQPRRRPESRLIVGNGKIDAAIANTLSVLRVGFDLPYGDFIPKLIKESPNDEDFLKVLGDEVARQGFDEQLNDLNSFVPRELVRAKWKTQKIRAISSLHSLDFCRIWK